MPFVLACCARVQLRKDHARLLKEYRHVRYMWLPYTNTVVVVVSNPYIEGDPLPK